MIDFANKAGILGQFWIEFRDDEDMQNFVEFNDVGLPLGYFIAEGLVKETPMAETFVEETFTLLLAALEVTEEELVDVTNLNELMAFVDDKKASE